VDTVHSRIQIIFWIFDGALGAFTDMKAKLRSLASSITLLISLTASCSFLQDNAPWLRMRFATFSVSQQHARLRALPSDEESAGWVDQAVRLRKEVEALEAAAIARRGSKERNATPITPLTAAAEYTDVEDSVWVLSYRFSNEPESDLDDNERRRFFAGKLTVKLRRDGYTDLILHESTGPKSEFSAIVKTWGWDVEMSKDRIDNGAESEYILFSVDFNLAPTSESADMMKERIYFQARVQRDDRTRIISFTEGTATVKRDVVQSSARWGLFSPTGILAQFRYVGDFVAKAGVEN
jgi:hypothetical protein